MPTSKRPLISANVNDMAWTETQNTSRNTSSNPPTKSNPLANAAAKKLAASTMNKRK